MKVLYAVFALCLILFSVFNIKKTKWKFDSLIGLMSAFLTIVIGIVLIISKTAYTSLCIGAVLAVAISFFVKIIFSGKTGVLADTMLFASKAVGVLLVIEMLVFNFNTLHLWGGNYENTALSISNAQVAGLDKTADGYISNGEKATIEFNDIDKEIGTIKLDLSGDLFKADYSIDFTDETNASYYMRTGLVKGSWYKDIESSKYIVCSFSGKVKNLRINITPEDSKVFGISDSVILNEDYPAEFSLIRFLVFLLSIVFTRIFTKSVFMKRSVKDQPQVFRSATAVILIVCVLIMLFMAILQSSGGYGFKSPYGNQITQELVDSFENSKVTLDAVPSKELLEMENPYDWSARVEQGVDAKWDHVLYNGKYYSYYGAGPVVLLFLPYHMLTGYYFPSGWATFLFSAIGIVFLGLVFKKLIEKHFGDIPMGVYITSLVMVLVSCGIWYCIIPSNFYEIAQTSGFCFVTLGAYFLVCANTVSKGDIKPVRLLLATLFLAIAVTCRPTTAIWCVVSLVFIFAGLRKIYISKKNRGAGSKPSVGYVKYLICALLPFVVIGGLQMLYNYVRFDSFTDFGIQYSLTINDFTNAQYHTQLAAIGFYDYLFAPPSFSADFPFVWSNVSNLSVNGYYFIATNNGCGLLFRALPVFALFFAPYAIKHLKRENRGIIIAVFVAVAIAAPCVVIFSIWESGYGVRYMVDFAWQMVTCSLFVIYLFYRNTKHEETKRIYRNAFLVMMFLCVIVNAALTYSYIYPGSNTPSGAGYLFESVARAFTIFK